MKSQDQQAVERFAQTFFGLLWRNMSEAARESFRRSVDVSEGGFVGQFGCPPATPTPKETA